MEGFLRLRLAPWARRLLIRGVAVPPVLLVTLLYGEGDATQLLIFSQVILSMQLPLAVVPLLQSVSDQRSMGPLAIGAGTQWLAWAIALAIVGLSLQLLTDLVFGRALLEGTLHGAGRTLGQCSVIEAVGKTVNHQIQGDVMLQAGLESG